MKQPSSPTAIEKSLRILLAFDEHHPVWGVRELSVRLGFSPATVLRALQALKSHDFVQQDADTRQYRLGPIYFRFLNTLKITSPVNRAAFSFMQALAAKTGETVHLNIIHGNERVCVESLESQLMLKGSMPLGNRSPLYAGASSKCLLAFSSAPFVDAYLAEVDPVSLTDNTITNVLKLKSELANIHSRGYAASLGERTEGLGALSAPVRGPGGVLLAALSLAIPEIRYRDPAHLAFCRGGLLEAAAAFSRQMGFSAPAAGYGPV